MSSAEIEGWLGRVEDVVAAIGRIESFMARTCLEAFAGDAWAVGALSYQLIIVAEATKAMAPGLAERHPDVPWNQVRSMRNVLAHEYGKVDAALVWGVAVRRLAPLKAAMQAERDWLEAQ